MAIYLFQYQANFGSVGPFLWHAHEMVFGYAMAVIAGFVLTAAWNWTGQRTADGGGLAAIFLPWVVARLLMFGGADFLAWATAADLLFMLGLGVAVARPIIRTRQKRQATVLLVLLLLMGARLAFQLGASGVLIDGARFSVHAGLYLVLGMVLFMGRRVIPFFTQRGVGYEVKLKNERWNDIATFVLYPLFVLSELFMPWQFVGALLAAGLFVLNTLRVMGWHTVGIWRRPLLWGLFIAFVMINLGFLLRALMPVTVVPAFLPIHAFAVGGVGVVTVSMMARVTLGHTGRNVHQAPPVVTVIIGLMLASAIIRVFPPLVDTGHYRLWITVAAVAWIASFGLFLLTFAPMLLGRRADDETKKPGAE
jgi:uncharacterized protein involved in response to NO